MCGTKLRDSRDDRRLRTVILNKEAGQCPGSPGTVINGLPPIETNELLRNLASCECQFAPIIRTKLYGEVSQRYQQGEFVGRSKFPFGKEALKLREKAKL